MHTEHSSKNCRHTVMFGLISLLLTGCASTVVPLRFYPPPAKTGAHVARLINRNGWSEPITITAIDGKPVTGKTSAEKWLLEVLPGTHSVTARSNTGSVSTATWQAEAGQMYKPAVLSNQPRNALGGLELIRGEFAIVPDLTHYLFKIVE